MKILTFEDLKPVKGIAYSKINLWRMEKRGEFPKRVPLGRGRHGWADYEVDAWIEERIRARDEQAA